MDELGRPRPFEVSYLRRIDAEIVKGALDQRGITPEDLIDMGDDEFKRTMTEFLQW